MSNSRNWKRARSDAAGAVEALGDAVSIAGSGLATKASSSLAEGISDARSSLAHAIDPHPVRTRRLPWLLAALALTVLSVWGWRAVLTRPKPTDPGTPPSTAAPREDELFGKPVGTNATDRDLT